MFNFKEYITNKNDKLWPISHTYIPLFLFFVLRTEYKIDILFQFTLIVTLVSLFEFVELFAFMILKEDTDETVWNVVFNDIGNGVIAATIGVLLYNAYQHYKNLGSYITLEKNYIPKGWLWFYFIFIFGLCYGLFYSLVIFRLNSSTWLFISWFIYTTVLFIVTRYVLDYNIIKELRALYIVYCLYMSVAGFIPLVADVSVILMKYVVDIFLIVSLGLYNIKKNNN